MDVYSLTRKKRPSHLTLAQPSRIQASDNDSGLDVSISKSNTHSRSPSSYTFDEVTGSPSRDHWKPDSAASHCELIGCSISFGLFERRHHCRKCGNIFCTVHCSNYFRLDQYAQFHPQGSLSRGCDTCATDYIQWQEELRQTTTSKRRESNNTVVATVTDKSITSLKKRHAGIMTQQPQAMEGVTELGRDDIVDPQKATPSKGVNINKTKKDQAFNPIPSVPADWQWSTF